MRLLTAIIDALIGFVQRNPLTVLILLILALGAPALLKGIALFILYFFLGIAALVCILLLMFRWRIRKIRRQMEDQFGGAAQDGFGQPFGGQPRDEGQEGDINIYKTSETPQKRVSKNVGDYVDFEEEKDKASC